MTVALPSSALGLAIGVGGHAALQDRQYGTLASIGLAWSILSGVGVASVGVGRNLPDWLYAGHASTFAGMIVFLVGYVIHGRRTTRAQRAARRTPEL